MAIAAIFSLFAPLPYVVIKPGPTQNVLTAAISLSNLKSYSHPGELFSTSVLVSNPESAMYGPELIMDWIAGDSVILPRVVLYPKQETTAAAKKIGAKEMADSQSSATTAALHYLTQTNPKLVQNVSPSQITIALKETGGPSAGLVFALGLIAKLAPTDFIKDRKIAGTGTIDNAGKVGPIGGVDQKLIGARRAGAQIFLLPIANCSDMTRQPKGLTVIPVRDLTQAITVLLGDGAQAPPTCPNRI
jgi:PDZ domain-containing protein